MKKASAKSANGKKSRPKIKLGIPDLEHSKIAVLRRLGSPDSRRGYKHAIDEFVGWYCSEPRLAFNKTVVLRHRFHSQERGLAAGTINVRLAAISLSLLVKCDCVGPATDLLPLRPAFDLVADPSDAATRFSFLNAAHLRRGFFPSHRKPPVEG